MNWIGTESQILDVVLIVQPAKRIDQRQTHLGASYIYSLLLKLVNPFLHSHVYDVKLCLGDLDLRKDPGHVRQL